MKPLHLYYLGLCKKYRRYLQRITLEADAESIHELRIIIKKIRAVYHLLASSDSGFDFDKHFEPFNRIFKVAGKIRDVDITLERISKFASGKRKQDLQNIAKILHRERIAYVLKAETIAKQILEDGALYDETADRIIEKKIDRSDLKQYLAQTLSEIKDETRKHISNGRLHGIRKLYKEYLYDSKGTGTDAEKNLGEKYSYADDLQKQIGDWHDYLIACKMLKDISQEEKTVDKILQKLKKEKKRLKKSIVGGLLSR
jgi:CHAD domain-containing protein